MNKNEKPEKILLTRPVTVIFHEPVMDKMRVAAEEDFKSIISDYVRHLVIVDLLRRRLITPPELENLS